MSFETSGLDSPKKSEVPQREKLAEMDSKEIDSQIKKFNDILYSHQHGEADNDKHMTMMAQQKLEQLMAEKKRREGAK